MDEMMTPLIPYHSARNDTYSTYANQYTVINLDHETGNGAEFLPTSIPNNSVEFHHFNFPLSEVYNIVKENNKESYLGPTAKVIIMVAYITLIVLGTAGNILVGLVIARKHEMRTSGNLYVINLTISDITLCLICMPFTLASLMKKNWELGSFICKLVPVLQCTNILVSTATIAAIAADRYMTIVRIGSRPRPQCYNQASVLGIWIVSLIFPLPLFSSYYLETVKVKDFLLYDRCVELWSSRSVQLAWLITLFLIQYIIPILVLVSVHISIKNFLNKHQMHNLSAARKTQELDRNRRTTILLTTIACTFAVSWLPWHVVNLLADFNYFHSPEYFYAIFGACHILAMSTACSNPVLYGWLNTNLKKEILCFLATLFKTRGASSHSQRNMSLNTTRLSSYPSPCVSSVPKRHRQSAPSESQNDGPIFSLDNVTLSPKCSPEQSPMSDVIVKEQKTNVSSKAVKLKALSHVDDNNSKSVTKSPRFDSLCSQLEAKKNKLDSELII